MKKLSTQLTNQELLRNMMNNNEKAKDKPFDGLPLAKFFFNLINNVIKSDDINNYNNNSSHSYNRYKNNENENIELFFASIECLTKLSDINVYKNFSSILPGASSYYLSNCNMKLSTQIVCNTIHSLVCTNIPLFASCLERFGTNYVLYPILKLLLSVYEALQLRILKDEICCSSLVRLIICGIQSGISTVINPGSSHSNNNKNSDNNFDHNETNNDNKKSCISQYENENKNINENKNKNQYQKQEQKQNFINYDSACEACKIIIAMGKTNPDTVKAVLSRCEVENNLIDLINSILNIKSILMKQKEQSNNSNNSLFQSSSSSSSSPSTILKIYENDLHCLCLALEALTVLSDCYNPCPYYIFDPTWSVLNPYRRILQSSSNTRKEFSKLNGKNTFTSTEFKRSEFPTCPDIVSQILSIFSPQNDAKRKKKIQLCSLEYLILLKFCFELSSSLLLAEMRNISIPSDSSSSSSSSSPSSSSSSLSSSISSSSSICSSSTSPSSFSSLVNLRQNFVDLLFPLIPIALESGILRKKQIKPQTHPSNLDKGNIQNGMIGGSLLTGSSLQFINVLIQCDNIIKKINNHDEQNILKNENKKNENILNNIQQIIHQNVENLNSRVSPKTVYNFFSLLDTPSWAIGNVFENLFSSMIPTFEELCEVMNCPSNDSDSASLILGTDNEDEDNNNNSDNSDKNHNKDTNINNIVSNILSSSIYNTDTTNSPNSLSATSPSSNSPGPPGFYSPNPTGFTRLTRLTSISENPTDMDIHSDASDRAISLLHLVLHIMGAPEQDRGPDNHTIRNNDNNGVRASTGVSTDSSSSMGWFLDNQLIQLRGVELISSIALSGVDICRSQFYVSTEDTFSKKIKKGSNENSNINDYSRRFNYFNKSNSNPNSDMDIGLPTLSPARRASLLNLNFIPKFNPGNSPVLRNAVDGLRSSSRDGNDISSFDRSKGNRNSDDNDMPIPQFLHSLCTAMTTINNNNDNNNNNSNKKNSNDNDEKIERAEINKLNENLNLNLFSIDQTKAAGTKLRKAFVVTLKAIIETSGLLGCVMIMNSNTYKWLFLILKEESETLDPIKPNVKGRRTSITKKNAMEYYYDHFDRMENVSTLGYGDEIISSGSSTSSICCNVIILLSVNGFSKSLCDSGIFDAILNYMVVYNQIPLVQVNGISALIELLFNTPDYISKLLSPLKSSNTINYSSFNFFNDDKNRNPFASKNSLNSSTLSAKDIIQHAVNIIDDIIDCSFDEENDSIDIDNNDNDIDNKNKNDSDNNNDNINNNNNNDRIKKSKFNDMIIEQKNKLKLLLNRYKKICSGQENCSIS